MSDSRRTRVLYSQGLERRAVAETLAPPKPEKKRTKPDTPGRAGPGGVPRRDWALVTAAAGGYSVPYRRPVPTAEGERRRAVTGLIGAGFKGAVMAGNAAAVGARAVRRLASCGLCLFLLA